MNKTELILYKTKGSDITDEKVLSRKFRHDTQQDVITGNTMSKFGISELTIKPI